MYFCREKSTGTNCKRLFEESVFFYDEKNLLFFFISSLATACTKGVGACVFEIRSVIKLSTEQRLSSQHYGT